MIDAIYILFFWFLVLQVILFLFFTLPFPDSMKRKIVKLLTGGKFMATMMKVHLLFCFLSGLFFIDLYQTENVYTDQKNRLKVQGHGNTGSELRIGFLSYSILKVQRNKYVTFMLIYASLALNLYILLLKHIYERQEELQKIEKVKENTRNSMETDRSSVPAQESKKDK